MRPLGLCAPLKIQQMLGTMKATKTGFDYRIAYDPQTSEVTGVIWMTASMPANLTHLAPLMQFLFLMSLEAVK